MIEILRQRLRESLKKGSYPPFWTPKEAGEEIAGQVVRIRPSVWNPQINIYEIKTFEGESISTPNNAVLNRLLSESDVKIGDYIMIRYEGTVTTGKGRKAKDFSVSVIPKEEAEQILSQAKPPEPTPPQIKKSVVAKTLEVKPSIPDEVKDWAKELFKFYDEMPIEMFQRFLEQRGYKYPAEVVAEAAGLRVEGGKVLK